MVDLRVYGPSRPWEGGNLRKELTDLYGLCSQRWWMGGEFNVTRFVSKYENEGRVTEYEGF